MNLQLLMFLFIVLISHDINTPCLVLAFQAVHALFDGSPGKEWGPDEKRINKLVFIGRNLDETALRKGFKGCLV